MELRHEYQHDVVCHATGEVILEEAFVADIAIFMAKHSCLEIVCVGRYEPDPRAPYAPPVDTLYVKGPDDGHWPF
jgi:hypothetical protein